MEKDEMNRDPGSNDIGYTNSMGKQKERTAYKVVLQRKS